jgi:hypothetical protein
MIDLIFRIWRLALLLIPVSMLAAQKTPATDWQVWSEVDVIAQLSDRLNVTVPLVIRDSFGLANPQLAGLGPVFDFSLTRFISVSGGYLFVSLPEIGPGYAVHVPLAAITLREAWRRFHFSDRNRAERLIGLPGSPIRYRNKLAIERPVGSGRFTPFVSDEVFYDFTQSEWTQNRLEIGVGTRLNRPLKLDTYYLEHSAHKSRPLSVHAIGVTLEIQIAKVKRSVP